MARFEIQHEMDDEPIYIVDSKIEEDDEDDEESAVVVINPTRLSIKARLELAGIVANWLETETVS